MYSRVAVKHCFKLLSFFYIYKKYTPLGRQATASQWRQSSMTSFVLSPFADARTCLYKAIFDGFGGIWTPKCCRSSCGPPKGTSLRHNACFEPSCVKFHARVTSAGESGEKINQNQKDKALYFMYLPDAPLRSIGKNFGLSVWLADVINCAKFYRNRLRGLDSVRGRSLTIPIGLRCRR